MYGTVAHTAPGDNKIMELVNLRGESGVSCPDLKAVKVPYRDYCVARGNVSHKMCSPYCDPIATRDG